MNELQYPVKFKPILKEKIWGGKKLCDMLNKPCVSDKTGESWEISGHGEDVSVVAEGPLKGKRLDELIRKYREKLVGKAVYEHFGEEFPLLIKFIDAAAPLSIQLHPGDELAKTRHNSFGKTEMWYVMQADPEGNLIVGFNRDIDKETYLKHLNDKTLTEILNTDKVKEGDVYFIPTGRVHAIGAGVLLAEIQQTSDITYRIYDWDRVDDAGNSRELHTELALDALDYTARKDYRTNYTETLNDISKIVECKYFTTSIISLNKPFHFRKDNQDSFSILMAVKGEMTLRAKSGETSFNKGETLLIPAELTDLELIPHKQSKVLEIHIDL